MESGMSEREQEALSLPEDTSLKPSDLLDFYIHVHSSATTYLDLCHKYLVFFTGILSTIVGAMVVGLWSLAKHDERAFLLLLGPVAVALLSRFGYQIIKVFYRRFSESRLTSRNLEVLLGLTAPVDTVRAGRVLKSRYGGGFLTRFERNEIRRILDQAETSEDALESILKCADTLAYTKWLLIGFVITAVTLAGIGIVRYLLT